MMFGVEGLWRMLEGQVIKDQYYLQQLLGAGTYGGVFRTDEVVRDTCLRSLATKLISLQNPDQIALQLQELQVALRLDHANLLRCYGAGEVVLAGNAFLYLLMELAEKTLQTDLTKQKQLTPDQLSPIVQDVAAGLACLHRSQQIHLDIKPANILQVGDRWKIGDYGLVRSLNSTHSYSVTRGSYGTPLYVPPESYEGILSSAWDMWSLGMMAAILLTGQYPIRYQTEAELSEKIKTGQFDNLRWDGLPSPWHGIIKGCLQVNRGDRWNAEQVLEALRPPVIQIPGSPPPEDPQFRKESTRKLEGVVGSITEDLGGGIKLELIQLAGGEYLMGASDGDSEADDCEKPQHRVKVAGYGIGKYPITQEQYQAVMGKNPSWFRSWRSWFKDNPKNPVEQVSWNDAQEFCKKLSQRTGKKYRLPSEAEWEYACRAGTTTRYSFGDNANLLGDYAWFDKNSKGSTQPVGGRKPNPWGLYDMHGNVREWCEDRWHDNYEGAPEEGRALIEDDNFIRVLRGGSWRSYSRYCRSSCRFRYDPDNGYYYDGFRVVVSP